MFGTIGDKSVFHSIMSNRLSDRYPGRCVLNTPHIDSTSTHSPFAGRLVGRMQYAPTLSGKDEVYSGRCFPLSRTIADSLGRCYLLSRTIRDEYVFNSIMSNRLSDRYPCRGVLNTPHIDSTSIHSPFAGRLVGRMQYAPTLPAEKSDFKGWREVMSETRGDEYVFHFFMSNQLSDGYPGRGVLHTPHIDSTSTLSPFAECIGGVCNTPLPCRKKNRI